MDTIREQVVKAIIARLDSLTDSDVLRREQYEDAEEFVCVWDGEHQTEKSKYGKSHHTMQVVIEYLKDKAPEPYSESANAMYGEVLSAVMKDATSTPDPTLGGLAVSMMETGTLILTPDAGMKIIGCSVTLDVIFETENGDPFTQ